MSPPGQIFFVLIAPPIPQCLAESSCPTVPVTPPASPRSQTAAGPSSAPSSPRRLQTSGFPSAHEALRSCPPLPHPTESSRVHRQQSSPRWTVLWLSSSAYPPGEAVKKTRIEEASHSEENPRQEPYSETSFSLCPPKNAQPSVPRFPHRLNVDWATDFKERTLLTPAAAKAFLWGPSRVAKAEGRVPPTGSLPERQPPKDPSAFKVSNCLQSPSAQTQPPPPSRDPSSLARLLWLHCIPLQSAAQDPRKVGAQWHSVLVPGP